MGAEGTDTLDNVVKRHLSEKVRLEVRVYRQEKASM